MLIYPMSAVDLCFFTRRSGRAETCDCLLPSPGENRGHDIRTSTRNPFLNLWVKAQTGAHPRINECFRSAFSAAVHFIICGSLPDVKAFGTT